MSEVKITAMLDLANGDASWEEVGRDLGNFLDANTTDFGPADVVMTVYYAPEDDEYLIRLPGYMKILIPRWQLEKALELSRQGGA
jgi:antitoxin component HigA of HigAB toxin-antitoxin module